MRYVIVIPARNEEQHIGRLLETLAKQSLLPQQALVVDDGSTDRTAEVVLAFAKRHPWLQLYRRPAKEQRAIGAKVVRAFSEGYAQINTPHDFLVKLDADLELPSEYFERIARHFAQTPRLGIAGGTIAVEKNGKWVYENFSDTDHVKGAFKAYRRECFEQIGGLRPSIGWDTADELLARYHGWDILVDTSLQVRHHRPLGTETGSLRTRLLIGNGMYRLRYGFFITLISALKAGYLTRPYGLTGLAVMLGWLQALLRQDDFIVTPEEGRFIRQWRKKRMWGKVWGATHS